MKAIRVFALIILCVLSFSVHAEIERNKYLLINNPPICEDISLTVWGKAHHPSNGKPSYLNEQNEGVGFRCYLNKNGLFFHADGLTNSQYGQTFLFGVGKHFELLSAEAKGFRLSLSAGASLTGIAYEKVNKSMAYGLLPVPQIEIRLQLPRSLGTIGIQRSYLIEGISIDSLVWGMRF